MENELIKEYKTNQINLKISNKLLEEAQEYSRELGYTNVQELIRESIREKVFEKRINPKYIKELLTNEDFHKGIGTKESTILLEKMRNKNIVSKLINESSSD